MRPGWRFCHEEARPEHFGKAPASRFARGWSGLVAKRRGVGTTRSQVLKEVAQHLAQGGNVGLLVPEGVEVVDADCAASSAHMRKHYPLSPRQLTRDERAHFWFKLPAGCKKLRHGGRSGKPGEKVQIAPGIEVDGRHHGNQVVVAPSVHKTGARYVWEIPLPPTIDGLPELPPELVAAFEADTADGKTSAPSEKTLPKGRPWDGKEIPQSKRNKTLFRHGCRLRYFGKSQDEIEQELLAINREWCRPPLDEGAVRKKAADAAKYPPGSGSEARQGKGDGDEMGDKQADLLLRLVHGVELFHDLEGQGYATFQQSGARQTHRLRSAAFRHWLAWRAYNDIGFTPNANAVAEALSVIEGRALFDSPERQVFRRVAEHEGKLYVDLCNTKWEVVEVDAQGWRVVNDSAVRFMRSNSAKPLPVPVKGGSIGALRPFLNVADQGGFDLCVGWIVGAFRPRGPYAVLRFFGPQGSAKSTATRVARALVDPAKAPVTAIPRSEDDLVVAAQHSYVVAIDNVSRIPEWLSDALCRLATGGGVAKRKLYTDDEQSCLEACRAVILNGIGCIVERGDAADRMLDVGLRQLSDGAYRPEDEFWRDFYAAAPGILGAVLDAVSCALRRMNEVTGTARMADFARWVEAASPSLGWKAGYFSDLYAERREQARQDMLSLDELASALIAATPWSGTATELLDRLRKRHGLGGNRMPAWLPKAANTLSGEVDRLVPTLRAGGVVVSRPRTSDRQRSKLIELSHQVEPGESSPASSASPNVTSQATPVAAKPELPSSAPSTKAATASPMAPDAAGDADDSRRALTDKELERMADEEDERRHRETGGGA